MTERYDMPPEDRQLLAELCLTDFELSVIFNWQFAIAENKARKLADFLNSLSCDFDIEIWPPCEGEDDAN